MKSHLGVLETQETQVTLLTGMEYLVGSCFPAWVSSFLSRIWLVVYGRLGFEGGCSRH